MLGKQHLIFGISTATALAASFAGSDAIYFQSPAIYFAGAALGSIMPDIDTHTSMIGQKVLLIPVLLNKLIGHRTYTHDPVIWIPLAIFLTIKYPLLFGFFFGYLGHIFLDSLTAGGIPVCYLFNKKYFHALPRCLSFKADSVIAKVVTVLATIAIITLIWLAADILAAY